MVMTCQIPSYGPFELSMSQLDFAAARHQLHEFIGPIEILALHCRFPGMS